MSRLNVDQIYTRTGTGTPAIREMPAFSVELNTNQSFTVNSADVKVNFDTVNFDTNSYWDATNYRYTPQVGGYYQFNTVVRFVFSGGQPNASRISLYKNGSIILTSQHQVSGSGVALANLHIPLSYMIYCNGSTDYVEVFGWCNAGPTSASFGGSSVSTTVNGCFFSGFLVRPD